MPKTAYVHAWIVAQKSYSVKSVKWLPRGTNNGQISQDIGRWQAPLFSKA